MKTLLIAIFLSAMLPSRSNAQPSIPPTGTPDTVYLASPQDVFDIAAGKIDDFKITSDWVTSWPKQRAHILREAQERGANLALIDYLGWDKRGHAFYASGTFYRAGSAQLQQMLAARAARQDCAIVIFRDNGPSLATYTYHVSINDREYPKFGDMSYIRQRPDSCNAEVRIKMNRRTQTIRMAGKARYFRLVKSIGAVATLGPVIVVPIGAGLVLQEIGDEELGRLLYERLKPYAPAAE